MKPLKKNIRDLNNEELATFFLSNKTEKFRSNQVMDWLWNKAVCSFDEMTNLSFETRELLKNRFSINPITLSTKMISSDGTIKNAFQLYDQKVIEGVLIPSLNRVTACISSQVGCSLTCKFCATGKLKRLRNLTVGEIFDQVVLLKKQSEEIFKKPLSNIVYMGMGEPLLNYNAIKESVHKLTSPSGLNISSSRITVSTAGISKMIKKFGDDQLKVKLALSLHAANDKKRNEIMPINEQNSLKSLIEALKYYYEKIKQFVTLEYIIFKGFNDSLDDARELLNFTKHIPCKINVIEYNSIGNSDFEMANKKDVDIFIKFLKQNGIVVNLRKSRGKDINAACGQLANKK